MTHKNIYLASALLMLLCMPAAAQGPDTSKPVWAFHKGDASPYATFDNLYSALNDATGDGINHALASNDIIELHGDVHEPDDLRNSPAHNTISVSLTIRSEEGEKYTVYSPGTGDASYYFMFGDYKGATGLTLTMQDIKFDNSGFTNTPYFLYVMWNNETIILDNVDVIGGGGITAFSGYSNLPYAFDNIYRFTDCTFKDIPTTVISLSPRKGENQITMTGCTIENCNQVLSLSGEGSGYISGMSSAVLNDVKVSGCERCFYVTGDCTCEINGDDTLVSGNGQVLELGWDAVFTVNGGTFSDNHTTGSKSVFSMSDDAQSNHNTTLIINGGSFIGNSTEEGGVFQQYRNGCFQLHGGYFKDNNTGRNGEVLTFPSINEYVSGTGYVRRYAEVDVSGAPVFEDGQYICLEKWLDADKAGGYDHDQYDLVQQMYKDGPISPSAHINISADFGTGFHGTHELSFLVSGSSSVTGSDLDAFTVTNTGSTPVLTLIKTGTSRDGIPSIVFSDCTTFNVTRYDLQNGDSAIFYIYKETAPGVWTKVHSFSLTGKVTGSSVSRTVNVSGTGNFKIVETDFNWKYEKTGTVINGVSCSTQGEGTATGNVINFEVHGAKIHHEGTEDIKKNIFKWRDNPWY